jgi:hypothetical protein
MTWSWKSKVTDRRVYFIFIFLKKVTDICILFSMHADSKKN